ncbi:hypothetical protein Tco_1324389, partial [Tanacetum coccineum]
MSSNARGNSVDRHVDWDYRWMEYPSQLRHKRHPNDQSVSTYKVAKLALKPSTKAWKLVLISSKRAMISSGDGGVLLLFATQSSISDYVAAERLRRMIMYYHTEIFKNMDVIFTPTTG